jgi:iron complex outermembrane receptor protein
MHLLKVTIWLFFYSEWYKKAPSFSQYSLNSLKHQFVGSYNMQFLKNFTNTISYRYAERIAGDSYSVVDLGASYTLHAFELSLFANNIFKVYRNEFSSYAKR